MWERINQSEVVVRRNILPARVVLDRDAEFGEYRTWHPKLSCCASPWRAGGMWQ